MSWCIRRKYHVYRRTWTHKSKKHNPQPIKILAANYAFELFANCTHHILLYIIIHFFNKKCYPSIFDFCLVLFCYIFRKFREPVGFPVPFSNSEINPIMVSSISSSVEGTRVLSSFTVSTMSTISARAAGRSK